MAVVVHWSSLGIGSVLAFVVGWWIFGLFGAVILALLAMVLLGIISFR